ncbi:DUF2537 domain-containing protein [Saccharopolyspora erythraea]|uniref:DUF2537 domain-containing protein n=1 Tax=Saccharopolyspora erythraea TaxID=1836 RepID=UPI001BA9EC8E|nr:DUF2537 domain-containing protein [Saccharopolyspora erythraea]QUG99970.1 DUF2537 domain-containing protein [Saccharopolyspora erythraea]
MKSTTWELRARSGRAVLVNGAEREVDPARLPLPEGLVDALHEWAHVVDAISEAPAGEQADEPGAVSGEVATQVSRRGRQLALRLAVETGGEIGYADPVTGEVDRVGRRRTSRQAGGGYAGRYARGAHNGPVPPTPWATGLTITAIIAAIVVVTLVVVTQGLAEVSPALAIGVNVVVAAGFAPSIWLGRRIPVWRWVAFGTAAGVALAWIALLLSALGPSTPGVH